MLMWEYVNGKIQAAMCERPTPPRGHDSLDCAKCCLLYSNYRDVCPHIQLEAVSRPLLWGVHSRDANYKIHARGVNGA